MRLQDHLDFTTLQWIKPELDATLSAAREALQAYVEQPADSESMRVCAGHLHQARGTLRMVELYGAALVATEMEALAAGLLAGGVDDREEAYAVMMRGLMQLPDYLERLSAGHRDVPVVLLPLLNDLRAGRKQPRVSESALFHPNLDVVLPAPAPGAPGDAPAQTYHDELVDLRLHFQQQLLGWIRGQDMSQRLRSMRKTLLAIGACCSHLHGRRLWWIAAGVLEGLEQGMLNSDAGEIRRLIARVDRHIRQLIELGEDSLRGEDADEVACRLLYIVAHAAQCSPHMDLLRATYGLDQLLPAPGELAHAQGSMAGHNRALLDSVSHALKDDLLRVKEALDLFLRQGDADPQRLTAQSEVLARVGDTLGMLALAVPRRVVGEQRRVLDELIGHVRPADEETLLDVAGALLYVEASLDNHIERLGSDDHDEIGGDAQDLPRAEALSVVATLMTEAISNTGKVKEAVVAFVESGWQHDRLLGTPLLMGEVAGAMQMLSAPRCAELAQGVSRFIDYELLADRRLPSGAQMDHLADAVAALDYYLEAVRDHRGGLGHILDVAEQSLGLLGYWPLPATRAAQVEVADAGVEPFNAEPVGAELPDVDLAGMKPADEEQAAVSAADAWSTADAVDVDADVGAQADVLPVGLVAAAAADAQPVEASTAPPVGSEEAADDDWIELETEIFEALPVRDVLAADCGFNPGVEGIDDDIREIFLEEMQEEIDSLGVAEDLWLADPAQLSALTGIRRSFHTLKGSGRLVGASVLGELAWKVENMLNHVLDGSIAAHADVQALVHSAIEALPGLLMALKAEGTPAAPLSAIMQVADQLAAGERARVQDHAPVGTEMVRRVVRERVPRPAASAAAPVTPGVTGEESEAEASHGVDAQQPAPAMPPVDPMLLEILRSEVAQYVQLIRTAIQQHEHALPIGEELLRAVHTLHGAISMVDIPLLTGLLAPLETLFQRLRVGGVALPTDGMGLLGQAMDVVERVMQQFDAAQPQLPGVEELTAQLMALRDRYPESQTSHGMQAAHGDATLAPVVADVTSSDLTPTADELDAMDPEQTPSANAGAAFDGAAAHRQVDAAIAAFLEHQTDGDRDGDAVDVAPAAEPTDAQHAEMAERLFAALDAFEPDVARTAASPMAAEPAAAASPDPAAERPVEPASAETAVDAPVANAATGDDTWPAADQAAAAGPIDADLLEIFIEEARELLDHADGVLARWHAQPQETGHVAELRRDLHTLKGSARIAGLLAVGDLAHAVETLLDRRVRGAAQTGSLIAALEGSFDQLNTLVQGVAHGTTAAYPQAAIEQLRALAGGQIPAEDGEATDASDPAPAAPSEPTATPSVAPAAASVTAATPPPASTVTHELPALLPEERADSASAQEQIRVRADLLDNLVNHAGEVAIYRSRLEQQVSGYRYNVVELEQTVARVGSQLRMLEIETEAQIIARFQREHREAGLGTFDPLELDRYSQLQQYSRALGESVADLVSIQGTLDELTRQAETLLVQQSRVSTELQEGLLRTRMLPFDTMVPNLRRTLRQAAREQSKNAQLYVDGAHGEMDRNLLDRIKAPFEHMLRNAVAHGIESPAERRKAGKPAEGSVHIQVAREATEVVIRVSDDGRGLDRAAIRKRGIERGLLHPGIKPTDNQLLALITQTGFSTAGKVTQLAGRGVGMDVVANEIKQLGGSLAIESEHGKGTTFILRVPFTLAVTQAILVRIGEATFAIPMTSVQGVARVDAQVLESLLAADEPSFEYGREAYGIHDLAELLGLPPGVPVEGEQPPLLLTRAGDLRAAIRIDAVLGSREIVVKSVGPQISSVPGLLGATIMGDGSVLVILDLAPLVRHDISRRQLRLAEGLSAVQTPVLEEVQVRPLVMVVDDSITMRKVAGRVLERHGYEVSVAKDGVDALEKLHERVPALMLLDIEMPRMDGYELATQMKADPRLRGVPIIMITSRSGDKHRQRAFAIGVDRYLGKPYQETDLLTQVDEVLAARALESGHD